MSIASVDSYYRETARAVSATSPGDSRQYVCHQVARLSDYADFRRAEQSPLHRCLFALRITSDTRCPLSTRYYHATPTRHTVLRLCVARDPFYLAYDRHARGDANVLASVMAGAPVCGEAVFYHPRLADTQTARAQPATRARAFGWLAELLAALSMCVAHTIDLLYINCGSSYVVFYMPPAHAPPVLQSLVWGHVDVVGLQDTPTCSIGAPINVHMGTKNDTLWLHVTTRHVCLLHQPTPHVPILVYRYMGQQSDQVLFARQGAVIRVTRANLQHVLAHQAHSPNAIAILRQHLAPAHPRQGPHAVSTLSTLFTKKVTVDKNELR